ncbi:preprotein translocase subunit SecG [Paramagnetospirillum magneticum]|uniref:Protein-export membrane protein SecG n=1 Tax=Paramagnetospirillum magneticum (strain ATCC 700264 / AMB-1) TaxID=342108 RepID=Q2W6A1_PARM1|nr:preprotein translocase subunit SecG [Paramagnetospirillum magneticum]BAE50624.1 Preprotein translocase subunit SecG [Paramagnetospirillum magneticum AMB-1]
MDVFPIILVIHLILAVALVGVILLQRSEGGALGIGGGSGGGLMTGRAAGNLLTRTTAIVAGSFFLTSLVLALLANSRTGGGSPFDKLNTPVAAPAAPVVPAEPAAPSAPLSR